MIRGATREDDKIVAAYIPEGIIDWIADTLEDDEDLGFKTYPMPYDLKITATGSGLGRRYEKTTLPPKAETDLTTPQLQELKEKPSILSVAEDRNKKVAVDASPAAVVEANAISQKRSGAEMNPIYTALERAVNNAPDATALNKAMERIAGFVEDKSIDEFEAGMLKTIVENKINTMSGTTTDNINVEDIPF